MGGRCENASGFFLKSFTFFFPKKKPKTYTQFGMSAAAANASGADPVCDPACASTAVLDPNEDDASDQKDKLIFKWSMMAIKDLNLAKEKPAEKMCSRIQSILKEFIVALQMEESRNKIKAAIPASLLQTMNKIAPRLLSLIKENKKEDVPQSKGTEEKATTKKRNKKGNKSKRKKNFKVFNKSLKKLLSAVKNIRRSEWNAFVTCFCAQTSFKTPENAIEECKRAMRDGGITLADLQTKLKSKFVSLIRGNGLSSTSVNSTSILQCVSGLLSSSSQSSSAPSFVGKHASNASGNMSQLLNIAHAFMSKGNDGSARSHANAQTKQKSQGILSSLLKSFMRK